DRARELAIPERPPMPLLDPARDVVQLVGPPAPLRLRRVEHASREPVLRPLRIRAAVPLRPPEAPALVPPDRLLVVNPMRAAVLPRRTLLRVRNPPSTHGVGLLPWRSSRPHPPHVPHRGRQGA